MISQEKVKQEEIKKMKSKNNANFRFIEALVDERNAAIDNMNDIINKTCVNELGAWPIWNIIQGRSEFAIQEPDKWNESTNKCLELFNAHDNCIHLSSKINQLAALAKLKALTLASNSLRIRENNLVSFLRQTQPTMADITVEDLRYLPYSMVSELMDHSKHIIY